MKSEISKIPAQSAKAPPSGNLGPSPLDPASAWDGLSRFAGNQALGKLLRARVAQAKLEVSQPGDFLEQEADRVAREVVSKPAVHTATPLSGAPPPVRSELGSPGRPLDSGIRASMEERFGRDFGAVRIHTGPQAEAAAASIQAQAFTIGGDVVFGRGHHPASGQELLAHELTHVAQQGHAAPLGVASASPAISSLAGATAPKAFRKAEFSDYDAIADLIHDAISGSGTNEEGVYFALRLLDRNPEKIKKLEKRYPQKYGETLLEAIDSDFDGEEEEYALQLINQGKGGSGQRIEKAPETPDEWRESARRLWEAMDIAGTDEEAIYAVLQPLNRDEAKIERLKEAYKEFDKEMGLVERIRDEMAQDDREYRHVHYLLNLPTPKAEDVTQETEKVHREGTKMTWKTKDGTMFYQWASAKSEAAAPPVDPATTINCWEMILLMAYRKKAITWTWINQRYTSGLSDWSEYLIQDLGSGPRLPYQPPNPHLIPSRGDIVFFNGNGHVALATGERDSKGTKILSFWPPPQEPQPPTTGYLDQVKVVTIEDLIPFTYKNGAPPVIEFAAPPW